MPRPHAQFRPAAWMMYLSGLAHLIAPLVSGTTSGALGLVPVGVLWIVLGWILVSRGWRWLAWVAFFLALAGAIAALGIATGGADVAAWLAWAVVAFDAGAAAALFVVLWRDRAPA